MLPGLEERLLFGIQKSWRSLLAPLAVLLFLSKSEAGKMSLHNIKEWTLEDFISGKYTLGSVKRLGKYTKLFLLNSLLLFEEGCHGKRTI